MSFDLDQAALDVARKFIPATDPQTLAKLQVEIVGLCRHVCGLKDEQIAKMEEREAYMRGDLVFQDHTHLIKFLDSLHDDNGQGGEPWEPAQAAKQGVVWWLMTAGVTPLDSFKNFHRSLCERFGYTHDPQYWWRDLVSLEEHIAQWGLFDEVYEAYMTWPEDIRKKLSLHDLRRMGGWKSGRSEA